MKRILYTLCQCTWGILQTLIGAVVFMIFIKRKHYFFNGAVATEWGLNCGVSLGLFIFVDDEKELMPHEYGHTIQSLILGPFYLLVIVLPSLFWAGLPMFKNMRKNKKIPYSFLYTEKWADYLSRKLK